MYITELWIKGYSRSFLFADHTYSEAEERFFKAHSNNEVLAAGVIDVSTYKTTKLNFRRTNPPAPLATTPKG